MKSTKNDSLKRTALAIVFNVIIASFCVAAFGIYYSKNYDDYIISQFLTNGSWEIRYSNYYFLHFLAIVQKLIYPLNAHVIIHLALAVGALSAITRVLLDKFRTDSALAIAFLLNCLFAAEHYTSVSFTNIPALLAGAGLLCIIHYSRERHFAGVIIGVLFAVIGSFYRFYSFLAAVVFIAAFIFVTELCEELKNKGFKLARFMKKLLNAKRLVPLVLVVVTAITFFALSDNAYNSSEELKHYSEYNEARIAAWDYKIPEFEECKEEYEKIGIDKNDYRMLKLGYLDENGAFPLERLKQIREVADNNLPKTTVISAVKSAFTNELDSVVHLEDKGVILIEAAIIFAMFLIVNKKEKHLLALTFLLLSAAFYIYLWYVGRVPFRAVYVVWAPQFIYLLYSLDIADLKDGIRKLFENRRKLVVIFSVLVSVCLMMLTYSQLGVSRLDLDNDVKYEMSEYFESHPENKYELSMSFDLYDGNFKEKSIFTTRKAAPTQNYKMFVCSYYTSPFDKKSMKKILNTDNMYSNLLNDNVYYVNSKDEKISATADEMKAYLEKYYSNGKEVSFELVKAIGDNQIYKFTV